MNGNGCFMRLRGCFDLVAGTELEPAASGNYSQGFALLAHQKYSRIARFERIAMLLIFSPQRFAGICRRQWRVASPHRAPLVGLITR